MVAVTRVIIAFTAGLASALLAGAFLQVPGEMRDKKAGRPCPVCGGRWAKP